MEIFGITIGGPLGFGGSALILMLIGFLLNKIITEGNIVTIKSFIYKPVFALFRTFTIALNGFTGGWWNKVGEPYFKLILTAILNTILQAATDGLDSDATPEIVYRSKAHKIGIAKRYTL